jgi:hypothetical protein
MITKVSDKYYMNCNNGCDFREVPDARTIACPLPGVQAFVHKRPENIAASFQGDKDVWRVTEAYSGMEMCHHETKQKVINVFLTTICMNFTAQRISEHVARNIAKRGLSPRYQLSDGLTNEQVTANMCLTGETSGNQQENKVIKTASKSEQAKDLRAEASTEVAVVPDPTPRQQDLDIIPDANVMSAEDAVRIESNIEKSSSNIYKWILQLYRGRAYIARGYPNWEAYYSDVTGKSRASSFRAVDEAIQKEKLVEMGVPAKFNQKQISALKPIIEKGKDAVEAVLKDAKKIVTAKDSPEKVKSEFHATGMLPASAIKKAVEKVVPPAPKTESDAVDVTNLKVVSGGAVDVTDQVATEEAPQAQIDVEATESHVESPKPSEAPEVHLLHFAACAWHLAPDSGIPSGCLKVETREGGYVLVPYSAMFEAYNTWPQEFMDADGNVVEPEAA